MRKGVFCVWCHFTFLLNVLNTIRIVVESHLFSVIIFFCKSCLNPTGTSYKFSKSHFNHTLIKLICIPILDRCFYCSKWSLKCTHVLVDDSVSLKDELIDAILAKKPFICHKWVEVYLHPFSFLFVWMYL